MSTLATWARFPEDDLVLLPVAHGRATRFGKETWIGGVAAMLVYAALGALIIPRFGVMTDSLARVANTYYVLFSRDPHVESIGFVWNPLPSILALPLVLLKGIWPVLVSEAVAANLVSAVFGGVAVYYLLRILARLHVAPPVRWIIAALFVFNPAVAFYAANGMSDMMMDATMLAATDGLWGYLEENNFSSLLASGMWLAVGFLIRYEVALWAAVVAAALTFGLVRFPLSSVPAHRRADWIKGLLLFWLSPLVVVMTTWIFLNWVIMANPFYFLQSAYGNASSIATGAYAYQATTAAQGNLGQTLVYMARQTLLFPPVVAGLVGLLFFGLAGRGNRHVTALILVAATIGAPLLQALLLYRGETAGWLRFFLPFVPFGFVLIAYAAHLLAGRGLRRAVWPASLLLILAGNVATTYALITPATPLRYEHLQSFEDVQPVLTYLNRFSTQTVLTDSYLSFPIIVRVNQLFPKHFFITSDRDFRQRLRHPVGPVDTILVPQPVGVGQLDAVNRQYPGLWAHGAHWAELIADFPQGFHWRLYAINPLVDSFRTTLSYIDNHVQPGDAVVLNSLFGSDAYLRYAHTNLPAYMSPMTADGQGASAQRADAKALRHYLEAVAAGRKRVWVIGSPDSTSNRAPQLPTALRSLTAKREVAVGQPGKSGGRTSGAIQLTLYTLRPTRATGEQLRPPTVQQLGAAMTTAHDTTVPWTPPVEQPGARTLLVGHLLTLPRSARSWRFAPLHGTTGAMWLTLFNNGPADATVWVADGSGAGHRVVIHVPAGRNVEALPVSWGGAPSDALTISADHAVVAMRSTAQGPTDVVEYAQLNPTTPNAVGGPGGVAQPTLSVAVPPRTRQGETARVTVHAAPDALIHVTMTLSGHPAVSLFDVTDHQGLLNLNVQTPRQIGSGRRDQRMRIDVQAMTEHGQTQTTRSVDITP